jgi:putative hydrolase of the HAD superfamily
MVRAVLFDLDDTLFDHAGTARDALMAAQGCHPSLRAMAFEKLERAHSTYLEELHAEVMLGKVPLEVARRERFRRLLAACGAERAEEAAAHVAETYRQAYRDARRVVAGASALLGAVRERAGVAIVSNNLLDEQQEKLRVFGLDPYVDALVVSEEVGVSKPDPRIFQTALARLGSVAADAVMVGDSWHTDIEGARAAGIRAVWFNPGRLPLPAGGAAVSQLYDLEPIEAAMQVIFDAHRR